MKKFRVFECTSHFPSGPVSELNKPMTNEPVMFTMSVPHGNVPPIRSAMNKENQNRATLPSAPPKATKIYVSIKSSRQCDGSMVGVISSEHASGGFPVRDG